MKIYKLPDKNSFDTHTYIHVVHIIKRHILEHTPDAVLLLHLLGPGFDQALVEESILSNQSSSQFYFIQLPFLNH